MSNGLGGAPRPSLVEAPKLTRKQQLGIEEIPPELMAQIEQHREAQAAAASRETPELPPGFPPGMSYSDFMKLPPEE